MWEQAREQLLRNIGHHQDEVHVELLLD